MSDYHVKQLRAVESRMEASRSALRLAVVSVDRAENREELAGQSLEDFRQALQEIDGIYFVNLFAVFEGILRTHLAQRHPVVRVTKQTKIDRLIFLVCQAESVTLDTVLRNRLETARDYRNYLAHGTQGQHFNISFRAALSALNTFVAKLPAPRP